MLYICSDRLRVEIAQPGEAPNNTSRFDRAGAVTEIILDGTHRFGASEPNNLPHPSTGGRGLMNAYRLDASGEVPVGGQFPRLGVGVLTKPDDKPYHFFAQYKVDPFPVRITQTDDTAVFVTEPVECLGYAVRQVKRVTVRGSKLSMSVRLTNVGQRRIDTQEYCHNFLTIDGMAVGAGYTVDVPALADQSGKAFGGVLTGRGSGYAFSGYSPTDGYRKIDMAQIRACGCFSWRLANADAGAYIQGVDSFQPHSAALWYADHMVCMEVFRDIRLAPGQSDEWLRTWRFDTL